MRSLMETVSSEWRERKWEQGDSVSNEMLQSGTGHILFEWRWRERSLNTAWIQVVPKTCRSRAKSKALANFSLLPRKSEDERQHQPKVERNQVAVRLSLLRRGRHYGCETGCDEVRI